MQLHLLNKLVIVAALVAGTMAVAMLPTAACTVSLYYSDYLFPKLTL